MSSQAFKTFEVITNPDGTWNLDVDKNIFDSGNYNIVTEDEGGAKEQKSLIVLNEKDSTLGNNITVEKKGLGDYFTVINFILFIILIIILAFNLFYLYKKIKTSKKKKKNSAREIVFKLKIIYWFRNILKNKKAVFGFYLVVLFFIVLTFVFSQTNLKQKIFSPQIINISGSLIDPLTNLGVSGIDLTVGNLSIKTEKSGGYTFNQISSDKKIKINNPNLVRSFLIGGLNDNKKDIYFNLKAFNFLSKIIDLEARGKYDSIYDEFYPPLKESVSREDFIKNYKTIFTNQDVGMQEINLSKLEYSNKLEVKKYKNYFQKVLSVTVENINTKEDYYLINYNDSWYLIR